MRRGIGFGPPWLAFIKYSSFFPNKCLGFSAHLSLKLGTNLCGTPPLISPRFQILCQFPLQANQLGSLMLRLLPFHVLHLLSSDLQT